MRDLIMLLVLILLALWLAVILAVVVICRMAARGDHALARSRSLALSRPVAESPLDIAPGEAPDEVRGLTVWEDEPWGAGRGP
jgi:hypothetical protein